MVYTEKEVKELLEQQRKLCFDNAKIVKIEYNNPYSECDGEITQIISFESIMNAVLEI